MKYTSGVVKKNLARCADLFSTNMAAASSGPADEDERGGVAGFHECHLAEAPGKPNPRDEQSDAQLLADSILRDAQGLQKEATFRGDFPPSLKCRQNVQLVGGGREI